MNTLPCPECEKNECQTVKVHAGEWYCMCDHCGHRTKEWPSQRTAIEAWNNLPHKEGLLSAQYHQKLEETKYENKTLLAEIELLTDKYAAAIDKGNSLTTEIEEMRNYTNMIRKLIEVIYIGKTR